MDKILETLGLSYEELRPDEREVYHQKLRMMQSSQLTLEQYKDYITRLREVVELELVKTPLTVQVWFFFQRSNPVAERLIARLNNLLLIDSFLHTPEKAKAALQRQLGKKA